MKDKKISIGKFTIRLINIILFTVIILISYQLGYLMGSFQMAVNFSHNEEIINNSENINNIKEEINSLLKDDILNRSQEYIDEDRGLREIECIAKLKEWDSQKQEYYTSSYYVETEKCYEVLG